MRTRVGLACGVFVAGLMSTPAWAQAPAAAPPPKNWTFTAGLDFPTAYVFRGIMQEKEGFIAQPFFDLGVSLGSGVSLNVGNWDSLHSGPTGTFYEADYYGSLTFTAGKLKPGVLFTSYTSPNDRFGTVHELAGVLAIDDSANAFPVNPKIILAFELSDSQADGGENKGTYLELGIRPAIKAAPKLTLAIPVKLGLSVKDYYEGYSDRFGFFDLGLQASIPLASGRGGALELHGGIDLLWLGNDLKVLNDDDGFKPVGLIGFTFTY